MNENTPLSDADWFAMMETLWSAAYQGIAAAHHKVKPKLDKETANRLLTQVRAELAVRGKILALKLENIEAIADFDELDDDTEHISNLLGQYLEYYSAADCDE